MPSGSLTLLTLSTCYYNIKSKFHSTKYLEWANNLLALINVKGNSFNLVIYTDRDSFTVLKALFVSNPKIANKLGLQIKIIIKPLEEFVGYKYKENWIKNHETSGLDLHQKVEWSLIMLWCEKVHFVNETVRNKIFVTPFYGWCDIGYFRNEAKYATTRLVNWPNPLKLLSLKKGIHYACVENNQAAFYGLKEDIQNHYRNKEINSISSKEPPTNKILNTCFAGGFFITRHNLIHAFSTIFDTKLRYYFENDYIVKDDQTILLDCIFNCPELFCLHWEEDTRYNNWFMFQRILL
jgi:hypothetical protein